ncbi:hypothetical protein CRYUN_Cryun37aG0034100 [Craigia yunnanensis]
MPFVVCSDPVLNRDLLSLERNSSSLCSRNEHSQFDHTQIVQNLRSKRVFLEKSGAHCIVVPCHISHSWHDEVFKGFSLPSLHMGECVARELKGAKLKPLEAGGPLRIGVLAIGATLKAGFTKRNCRMSVLRLCFQIKQHTVIPTIDALNRKHMEVERNLLRIALQVFPVRAVNIVILASDDMCDLLPRDDPLLKKCIDPMDALARSTITWARKLWGKSLCISWKRDLDLSMGGKMKKPCALGISVSSKQSKTNSQGFITDCRVVILGGGEVSLNQEDE